MPPRRRKPNNTTKSNQNDSFHNQLQVPNCQLLVDVAHQILPPLVDCVTTTDETPVNLARLLRSQLLSSRQTATTTRDTGTKKKRKKKKKKAKKEGETILESSQATNAAPLQTTLSVDEDEELQNDTGVIITSSTSNDLTQSTIEKHVLLDRLLNQYNDLLSAPTPNQTLSDFLTHLQQKHREEPLASSKLLQQAMERIQCEPCRSSLEKTHFPRVQRIPLIVVPNENMDNGDHYMSMMEEGRSAHPRGWYLVQKTKQEESSWCLEYQNTSDNNNNNETPPFWTLPNLEYVIRQRVLLRGLPLTQLLPNEADTKLIERVAKVVSDKCRDRMHDYQAMTHRIDEKAQAFHDTRHHAAGGNIETTAPQHMIEMNEVCDRAMADLLRILLATTRLVQGLWERGTVVPASVLQTVQEIWEMYANAVQTILKELAIYEEKVFALASAQGMITGMFCSSTHRQKYRDFVQAKLVVVCRVIQQTDELFNTPVSMLGGIVPHEERDWDVSLYRCLVAHEAYLQTLGEEGKLPQKLPKRMELDVSIEDVLYELKEWTQVEVKENVKKIAELRRTQRERLSRLLDNVQTYLGLLPESTTGSISNISLLRERVVLLQEEPEVSQEQREENPLAVINLLRAGVGQGIIHTIQPWLVYKTELPSAEPPVVWPEMPYDLRRRLVLDDTGKNEGDPCLGGYCQSRFEDILIALIFQWMSEQFQQWQAETAEKELLTTLLDDEQAQAKPQKKKRKKKVARVERRDVKEGEAAIEYGSTTNLPGEKKEKEGPDIEEDETSSSDEGEAATSVPEKENGSSDKPDDDKVICVPTERNEFDPPSHDGIVVPSREEVAGDNPQRKDAVVDEKAESGGNDAKGKESNDKEKVELSAKDDLVDTVEAVKKKPSAGKEENLTKKEVVPSILKLRTKKSTKATSATGTNAATGESVGVIAPDGFQSAEDFLVGRAPERFDDDGEHRYYHLVNRPTW